MKKLFAVLLSIALVLSLLSACGETGKKPSGNLNTVPTVCGMLVLTTQTSATITYDTDGMVTEVEDAGGYKDFLGKSCSTVVKELLTANKPEPDTNNIVLKVAVGSQFPTEFFLESLATDLEKAAETIGTTAKVTVIGLDGLDEEGYINAEIARTLLLNQLDTADASVSTNPKPYNGVYSFVVTAGGINTVYNVDAITGLISIEETVGDDNNQDHYTEEEPVPTEAIETFPEEEVIPEDTFADEV